MNAAKIYWQPMLEAPLPDLLEDTQDVLMFKPERVIKSLLLAAERQYAGSEAEYNRCPAVQDYLANVYAIRSPVSFSVKISPEEGRIVGVDTKSDDVRKLIRFRSNPSITTHTVISLSCYYAFYCKAPMLVEQLPAFFEHGDAQTKATVIPGTFRIDQWVRPVEVALEIQKGVTELVVKRGDILSYVRFVPTPHTKRVVLVRDTDKQRLLDVSNTCVSLKNFMDIRSLEDGYALVSNMVRKFVRRPRCPFARGE